MYGRQYSNNLRQRSRELPIMAKKDLLMRLFDEKKCILLEGETGSGKSTQVPQFCLEWLKFRKPNCHQMICCTQPRTLAAFSLAKRVAEEMDVKLGQEVGYSFRFEDLTSSRTMLKYCTDGMLLAECIRDKFLDRYAMIVLDEVHERSLNTDLLMGLIKEVRRKRPELLIVVMSACLNTGNFVEYFAGWQFVKVEGRSFPIEIQYSQENWGYYANAIAKVMEIHLNEKDGDILLFFTSEDQVEHACEELREKVLKLRSSGTVMGELICIPVYANMPNDLRRQIIEKNPPIRHYMGAISRRCLIATNYAETSLTIPGIVFVIDPGYSYRQKFDADLRIESLLVQRITQASAIQRAGRAGRTQAGKCYRMYTKECFENVMLKIDPEINNQNLTSVVLRLKRYGVNNLSNFEFIDSPPPKLLQVALEMLTVMELIDTRGELTPLGKNLSEFAVEPHLALCITKSLQYNCFFDVLPICAMLSTTKKFFYSPSYRFRQAAVRARNCFKNERGDHLTLLNIYNEYIESGRSRDWCKEKFLNFRTMEYAYNVYEQLRKKFYQIAPMNPTLTILNPLDLDRQLTILNVLLAGSFMRVAYYKEVDVGKGYYLTVDSQMGSRHQQKSPIFQLKSYVLSK